MATVVFYSEGGDPGTVVQDAGLRRLAVDENFSTIRTAVSATSIAATNVTIIASLTASTTSNQYSGLVRSGVCYDTATIPASATVTSATLSLYGVAKVDGLGTPEIDVVTFNPSDPANFSTGDYLYTKFGTTPHSSITYSSWSTSGYNDFTIPTASITKEGITKFGIRLNWDTDNSFGGSWSSEASSSIQFSATDTSGTTQDPKLVVEYTTGSSSNSPSLSPSSSASPSLSPSSSPSPSNSPSLSPSSSESPSLSPSSSVSPSLSPSSSNSPSLSPSSSPSPSLSPSSSTSPSESASQSPSSSESPSQSPSSSVSPSLSPSSSASPSQSPSESPSESPSLSPSSSESSSVSPSASPSESASQSPSSSNSPSLSPSSSESPSLSPSSSESASQSPSSSNSPSLSPSGSESPSSSDSPSQSASESPSPSVGTPVYFKNTPHYIVDRRNSNKDITVLTVGNRKIAQWNNTGRPTGTRGAFGFNTDTDNYEFYDGTGWNYAQTLNDARYVNVTGDTMTGSLGLPYTAKTADYILTASDYTCAVTCSTVNITITLPAVAGCTGRIYNIKKMDSTGYSVIVDGNDSETIDGSTTQSITNRYDSIQIQSTGSTWIII